LGGLSDPSVRWQGWLIDRAPPPMASRNLVNTYLRQARRAHPEDNDARIAWLDEQLADRDAAVAAGDWEVGSTAFGGESQSSKRTIASEERAEALASAIAILTKNPKAMRLRGGVVIPRFNNISD